jgi:integrase
MRVVLNQSYVAAVQNDLCFRNPISHIALPKNASQKYVRPTQSEQALVEDAAKKEPLGFIVLFFLYTGLRSNELSNLSWNDYDSSREIIK